MKQWRTNQILGQQIIIQCVTILFEHTEWSYARCPGNHCKYL